MSVWPLWQLQVLWWLILMAFTEGDSSCSLQRHRPGQEWGRRAPLCWHCLAGHRCWAHIRLVWGTEPGAAPCQYQCGTGWRTAWRHPSGAARADPDLSLCSSGMQEGSVGAICCPFLGNEVLASISSDNANTNPMLPQFHINILLHSTTISTTALGTDE